MFIIFNNQQSRESFCTNKIKFIPTAAAAKELQVFPEMSGTKSYFLKDKYFSTSYNAVYI